MLLVVGIMMKMDNPYYNRGDPNHSNNVRNTGNAVLGVLKKSPYYQEVYDYYTGKRK